MNKLLFLAILGGGSLFAAPCTTAPLSSYLATSFTCTLDTFTFQDFFFRVTASGGYTALTTSEIMVTPGILNTSPGVDKLSLTFTPTTTSAGFNLVRTQAAVYDFRYNIDPPPDVIIETDDQLITNSPVAPGTADVTTNLCIGGKLLVNSLSGALFCDTPGTTSSLNVFHHGTPTTIKSFDSVTFSGVHILGVDNIITLAANGSTSQIRSSRVPALRLWNWSIRRSVKSNHSPPA